MWNVAPRQYTGSTRFRPPIHRKGDAGGPIGIMCARAHAEHTRSDSWDQVRACYVRAMNQALASWPKRSLLLFSGVSLLAACGGTTTPDDGKPTTSRPGWELTESNTGLARVGLNCDAL